MMVIPPLCRNYAEAAKLFYCTAWAYARAVPKNFWLGVRFTLLAFNEWRKA